MSELKKVDVSNLHQKCPAFKDGCPYSKIGKIVPKIEKCPFKDAKDLSEVHNALSGLPNTCGLDKEAVAEVMKNVMIISNDLSVKHGTCPVFQNGCPLKNVKGPDKKPLVDPIDSVAPQNLKVEELKKVGGDLNKCPAFKEIHVQIKQQIPKVLKCPEFKDTCPFKNAKSIADVYETLSRVRHCSGDKEELAEMVKKIHEICKRLKQKHGSCPVFQNGCPMKYVRGADNKHLVEPADSIKCS